MLRKGALRFLMHHPRIYNLMRFLKGQQMIFLDYPVRGKPRYGHGRPRHSALDLIIGARSWEYQSMLRKFPDFKENLLRIPLTRTEPGVPYWTNDWFSGLDAVALYCILALQKPANYIEIGSGFSTMFAKRAVGDHALKTRIISVDPRPRAGIDQLCDEVVRSPLADVDVGLFKRLQPGDVLFMDGSHRCFTNSDVTVFFLEVLPELRPGVLVQVHDITLPDDYPPDWESFYYSEQYLLAVYLLAHRDTVEIVFPSHFVSSSVELAEAKQRLWSDPRLGIVDRSGASFWFRVPPRSALSPFPSIRHRLREPDAPRDL